MRKIIFIFMIILLSSCKERKSVEVVEELADLTSEMEAYENENLEPYYGYKNEMSDMDNEEIYSKPVG